MVAVAVGPEGDIDRRAGACHTERRGRSLECLELQ